MKEKIRLFLKMNKSQIVEYLWLCKNRILFNKRQYRHIGKKTAIIKPVRIVGKRNIEIGNNVLIRQGAYIYAGEEEKKQPCLMIADGVNVGHYVHIVANHNIYLAEDVLIADKVFISDCSHVYESVKIPIIKQGVQDIGKVHIGKGTWIGDNVSIIGASVGVNCVIGANSIVTHDIPDYSVAVGNPARVIKKYNFEEGIWESVYGIRQ